MAEGVSNKKLMVVALVLGVLAVILFYAYDSLKESRFRGERVRVLRWARDLRAGDPVTGGDILDFEISATAVKALEGVIKAQERGSLFSKDTTVTRGVTKNDFVRYTDILGTAGNRPSDDITEGMLGVALPVDPVFTPGELLRVNDRVDLIGMLSLKGKPAEAYTLIENLRVVGVGGRAGSPEEDLGGHTGRRAEMGLRVYRSITVEVTPEVARQLAGIIPRVQGRIWPALRNPRYRKATFDNRLNPEVLEVIKQPLPEAMM
jgi:Flp pilus assembly protein CpaB